MPNISVTSPVAGLIVEIQAHNGSTVSPHQTVLIIESMKMLMPINAPGGGTVAGMEVEAGTAVNEGTFLFAILG